MAGQKLNVPAEERIFAIHERLVQNEGGLPGLRRNASLSAIVQRVYNHARYRKGYRHPLRLAGLLSYAITVGHPFNDGNKRTALAASVAMLKVNGLPQPAPFALAALLVDAAAKRVDQEEFIDQFAALCRDGDDAGSVSARRGPLE